MIALFFNETLQLKEIEKPIPSVNEALVRVNMAGICNTDIELTRGYMNFKGVPGHEFVGVVEECHQKEWLGKRVCGEINFGCGHCDFCNFGLERHCSNRTVLGILNQNGAFAEYVIIPVQNLRAVPETVTDKSAVFVEPLAAAFEILEQVKIEPNAEVAVIGDGKLGLLICQVLMLTGCDLTLIGKHDSKLGLAKTWGVRAVQRDDLHTRQFDIVVEATGSDSGFGTAVQLLRPRGTLVLKSTYAGELHLDAAPLVINEISVVGSRCGQFAPAIRALKRNLIQVGSLIDKTFPFSEALSAFEYARQAKTLKVLLQVHA